MRFSIAVSQLAGPSKVAPSPPRTKTPPPRPATKGSPLPGPIRRSVAALPSQANPTVSSAAADAAAAGKAQSAKTLADSYKSLSPNTRILFGVALGIVGIAGLYWDRWVAPEEAREGDKPLVAVRVVDRER